MNTRDIKIEDIISNEDYGKQRKDRRKEIIAVSSTNKPPIIASTISCLTIIAIAANEPPKESEPVSPIKIFAGGALYQRKPRQDPTIEPQNIDNSPVSGIYCI